MRERRRESGREMRRERGEGREGREMRRERGEGREGRERGGREGEREKIYFC